MASVSNRRVPDRIAPEQPMPHVIDDGCRECLQIGLGAPIPDDGLHPESMGHYARLCKIVHTRFQSKMTAHRGGSQRRRPLAKEGRSPKRVWPPWM
jgi:hypothetical protein